jgi:hypothetical protein
MLNKTSTSTFRWMASRKARLIKAIDNGEISEAEACCLHYLSPEELAEWRRNLAHGGVRELAEKQIPQRRHVVLRDSQPRPLPQYAAVV